MTHSSPITGKERIQSLDLLRGFAILGILIMNIQSFSMPGAAYMNPTAYGDLTGINKWVWMLGHIFADQKFMSIFSILYGAGVVLVTEKAESKGDHSAAIHYRRTLWLLVIGLVHAHLIWYGDILVPYALSALFIYFFRKMKPKTLIGIGTGMVGFHSLLSLFFGSTMDAWPNESLQEVMKSWMPNELQIQEEINAITGSLNEQVSYNSKQALFMETFLYFYLMLWRAGGLMLVGMGFYKLGILTAARSNLFYRKGLIIGMAIGLALIIPGMVTNFNANWSIYYSMYIGSQFNYWGSLFMAFAYICGIMLIAKSNRLHLIRNRLAAVGQMALTNYIVQSVICGFIFYGIGLGLFGQIDRIWQLAITFSIWILIIAWSRPWLSRFRFGPLEWVWRSLTYWKRQPFRRNS